MSSIKRGAELPTWSSSLFCWTTLAAGPGRLTLASFFSAPCLSHTHPLLARICTTTRIIAALLYLTLNWPQLLATFGHPSLLHFFPSAPTHPPSPRWQTNLNPSYRSIKLARWIFGRFDQSPRSQLDWINFDIHFTGRISVCSKQHVIFWFIFMIPRRQTQVESCSYSKLVWSSVCQYKRKSFRQTLWSCLMGMDLRYNTFMHDQCFKSNLIRHWSELSIALTSPKGSHCLIVESEMDATATDIHQGCIRCRCRLSLLYWRLLIRPCIGLNFSTITQMCDISKSCSMLYLSRQGLTSYLFKKLSFTSPTEREWKRSTFPELYSEKRKEIQ